MRIGSGFALPVEAHLDAAQLVAVDVLVVRSGDHRRLGREQAGSGLQAGQAVGRLPGDGDEAVAVAGRVRGCGFAVAGKGFEHLRLVAMVVNLGEQP